MCLHLPCGSLHTANRQENMSCRINQLLTCTHQDALCHLIFGWRRGQSTSPVCFLYSWEGTCTFWNSVSRDLHFARAVLVLQCRKNILSLNSLFFSLVKENLQQQIIASLVYSEHSVMHSVIIYTNVYNI